MKNKAFISYASEDEKLATALYHLLIQIDNKYFWKNNFYFDKKNIADENYRLGWRKTIINNIGESDIIIPIFTKNSIKKSWVAFELGISDALEKKLLPTMVSGIDVNDTLLSELHIHDLSNGEHIFELVKKVFEECFKPDDNETIHNLRNSILENQNTKRIIQIAKERCVYIIGSKPLENIDEKWEERAYDFLEEITNELLKRGFSIASYPSVEHVGMTVATTVLKSQYQDKYKIAGIYKFDRMLKEAGITHDINIQLIDEVITRFRESYLKDKDYLIIIGGSIGTREEYVIAKRLSSNIVILPIPCFYGFGKELWENLKAKPICMDFKEQHCLKKCKHMNGILSFIEDNK